MSKYLTDQRTKAFYEVVIQLLYEEGFLKEGLDITTILNYLQSKSNRFIIDYWSVNDILDLAYSEVQLADLVDYDDALTILQSLVDDYDPDYGISHSIIRLKLKDFYYHKKKALSMQLLRAKRKKEEDNNSDSLVDN